MISFVQTNQNHCREAQDMLLQFVAEQGVEVALVSDPYAIPQDSSSWIASSGSRRAAIWIAGDGIAAACVLRDPEFVSARLNGVQMFSCYASPNKTLPEFANFLQRLEDAVRSIEPGVPVLIAGDLNARSAAWGDWYQDSRGEDLSCLFDSLGLQVLNEGSKPTFVGRGRGSIVDLTAVSESIVRRVHGWRVRDDIENMSDHQYITFSLRDSVVRASLRMEAPRGWRTDGAINVQHMEVGLLIAQWIGDPALLSASANVNQRARAVHEAITTACDFALKRIVPSPPGKPPTYWWNAEIAAKRRECIRAKRAKARCSSKLYRRLSREAAQGVAIDVTREEEAASAAARAYKEARKSLKSSIARSKEACWRELIASVDNDPWGKPYKLVTRKLRGPSATSRMDRETVLGITDSLFPLHPPMDTHPLAIEEAPPFSIEEVDRAVHRAQRKNTAPGLDNITGKIIKCVHQICPSMLLGLFNQCIKEGAIPTSWKRARVVLLRKGNKPEGHPSSYRPICLLSVLGKVLESMLVARLEEHVELKGGLSTNQFGFRKHSSTDDAVRSLKSKVLAAINYPSEQFCVAVSLDIKNAFNSIGWNEIMDALNRFGVPSYLLRVFQDYFSGRTAETSAANQNVEIQVSCGVPQGSVAGPWLWNLVYDRVLRLQLPAGSELIGFADDTLVIVSGKSVSDLESKANETLDRVSREIGSLGLELAANKTEAVMFTNKYKFTEPKLRINGQALETKGNMMYLGMVVERGLLFKAHISSAAAKAERISSDLGRLMPNMGGPKQCRRKLLLSVTQSVLLYGAPSWAHIIKYVPGNAARINRVQRKALLRSICAYRSVSEIATNILAATPPIDLLARERDNVFNERRSGVRSDPPPRDKTMKRWKKRVREATTGAWTRKLIPDIDGWCLRKHGELDFHTTQLLSGHGCFGQYLNKIGKESTSECHHCPEPIDSAEHTLFECPAWTEERGRLECTVGVQLDVGNLIPVMLSCPAKWEAVKQFARAVMQAKENAERAREGPEGPRPRRAHRGF